MRENFIITAPEFLYYKNFTNFVISLIISFIIIYPIFKKNLLSITSISALIVLTLILFVILISINNENLYNEMPSTLYPYLPNTGLDGISKNNYLAGLDIKHY
jgi:hypothetical protein